MSVPFRRSMILASAGSGKTFALSSELIGLLAAGVEPRHIMASTFTRKAAGEILDRVLLRLAEAAVDPRKLDELAHHAGYVKLDQASCLNLLAALTANLHRLNISTLDSFFHRAAASLSLELGLPPGWSITEELTDHQMRADAVNAVLEDGDKGMLVEMMRQLHRGDARRSVHERLLSLVDELHDLYRQSLDAPGDPWNIVPEPDRQAELDHAALVAAAGSINELSAPLTGEGKPVKNWLSAKSGIVHALFAGNWEDFLQITLVKKILDGEQQFDRKDIPDAWRTALEPIILHARSVLLRRLVQQAAAMRRLMQMYDRFFTDIQRRRRAYRFGDVTSVLASADLSGRMPDLFFRLDGRVRHLLLDEFQDTSIPQWQALKPVAEQVLSDASGERAALVVADPKQSIYGWRGAAPELVHRLGEQYHLDRETLAVSWRSSPVVLDVVNRVFENIADNTLLSGHREVADEWARDFEPHQPAPHHVDLRGYVRIAVAPAADEPRRQTAVTLRHAARLVRELNLESPGRSIGVLVRRNEAVGRLIYELRQLGVFASGEGGNPLTDSPAVVCVLALLQLADHPGDSIARYHVAHTPVGPAVGFTDHANDRAAALLAREVRRRLITDGYGPYLHWLFDRLASAADQRDRWRLGQLVELGHEYDQQSSGLRPRQFVELVRRRRIESPARALVRVMTYHQSKGLEFDMVVLPELDARVLTGGRKPPVIHTRDEQGRIAAIFPYLNEQLQSLIPQVKPMCEQVSRVTLRDALSQLYVAMTRARYALHMVVAPDGKSRSRAVSMANILREALVPGVPAQPDDPAMFEIGDARRHQSPGQPAAARSAPRPVAGVRLRESPKDRRRLLPRIAPSQLAGERVNVAHLLRTDRSEAMDRGIVMHAWAQRIRWIDEGLPDESVLMAAARAEVGAHPQLADWLRQLRGYLDAPAIRAALSRAAYDGEVTLHPELPFAVRDGAHIVEGRFDRLVVWRDGGRAIAAEVLDYKTDSGPVAEVVEDYRPQMLAYRRAAAKLFDLDESDVTAKLVLLAHGEVVTV